MDAARRARQVGAQTRHVALRRCLHVPELAAERHHGAPQGQQPPVLRREVLVKRLQRCQHNHSVHFRSTWTLTPQEAWVFTDTVRVVQMPRIDFVSLRAVAVQVTSTDHKNLLCEIFDLTRHKPFKNFHEDIATFAASQTLSLHPPARLLLTCSSSLHSCSLLSSCSRARCHSPVTLWMSLVRL